MSPFKDVVRGRWTKQTTRLLQWDCGREFYFQYGLASKIYKVKWKIFLLSNWRSLCKMPMGTCLPQKLRHQRFEIKMADMYSLPKRTFLMATLFIWPFWWLGLYFGCKKSSCSQLLQWDLINLVTPYPMQLWVQKGFVMIYLGGVPLYYKQTVSES